MPPLIQTNRDMWKARERLGLTQQEMATAIGYATNAYQRLEAGTRRISKTVARLVWMIESHGLPKWDRMT
jgi:transcriptional regulator with XRE-family HTH domain